MQIAPNCFEERYWQHRVPYDKGQADREHWQRVVGPDVDIDIDDDTLAELVRIDVSGWLNLNPSAIQWLTELAATGNRPWLLSYAPHCIADAISALPIAALFDTLVFSARIGLAKPSPECFTFAQQAMQTSADRILFIDDRIVNINAAAKLGMGTFLFAGDFPALPS